MLGVPSIFDLASVVLLVSGLMHVPASMWMLLRGGCIGAPLPRPCPAPERLGAAVEGTAEDIVGQAERVEVDHRRLRCRRRCLRERLGA